VIDQAIKERAPAEDSLRVSELRYRRLFETAQDGILILDGATGAITDANPFLLMMLEYTIDDLYGKQLWEIGPFKDIEESRKAFSILQKDDYIRYEDLPLQTKNGKRVDVEFVSNAYLVDGKRVIQCNIRDITERKGLEDQLRQAQKMEAVGRLAGGVAHDFNNLLTVVIGYSELVQLDDSLSQETHQLVGQVLEAAHRAEVLTRQLLAFSRKKILQPRTADLNVIVAGVSTMLQHVIGEDIDLKVEYSDAQTLVNVGEGLIEQMLMNLAVNARDAMPVGGRLSINTGRISSAEAGVQGQLLESKGDYVWLRVGDSGCGMTEITQARMFEPFFTTKEVGKGTGLGLSTVYGIVRQHRGWIDVTSRIGVGSVFTIYLPAATEKCAAPRQTGLTAKELQSGDETILLVEDEPALRALARRVLERLGYRVYEAGHAAAALSIWAQHRAEVDLLLTDIVMPGGMTGNDLALKLQSEKPELLVVMTSGYNSAESGSVRLNEGAQFMRKPYTVEMLSKTVRASLDSRVGGLREALSVSL
jgi:two-component system, cell cycle sensor histidine kinase and response regulator CckA